MAGLKLGQWRVAKACLRWARVYLRQPVDEAAIARRPQRRVSQPTPDLLTDLEVRKLVARAAQLGGDSGRALAHLVSTYGHRPQSLVQVRVSDVELGRVPRITLPVKSGDTIRHPILPETAALLRRLARGRAKDELLLRDPSGEPWAGGGKASAWFWHQVGEGVGIYQLKSYAISRMLDRKLDLKTIASITGHRTPAVLLRYARTNETRQQRAIRAIAVTPR
jgi:hypothetical protein